MYDNNSTMYATTQVSTFYRPQPYGTGLYDNNSGNGGGWY